MSCATVVEQKLNRCIILLQCHVVDAVALIFQKCQLIGIWMAWFFMVQGILALSGMTDLDVKPILYCSCSDKSVHLYELPMWVQFSLHEKSFFSSLLDSTNISDFCFRFTDGQIICKTRSPDSSNRSWGPLFYWGSDWFADSVYMASRLMVETCPRPRLVKQCFISCGKRCTVFWVHFPLYSILSLEILVIMNTGDKAM